MFMDCQLYDRYDSFLTVQAGAYFPPAKPTTRQVLALGTKPGFIAPVNGVAVDDRFIYATHFFAKAEDRHTPTEAGWVVVIDRVTFKEVVRIPVGFQPCRVAVNPNTNRIYAVNSGRQNSSLSIVDRLTFKEIVQLELWHGPIDIAVNAKTNRVYVTNWFQNIVYMITEITHEVSLLDLKADGHTSDDKLPFGPLGITVDESHEPQRIYITLAHRSSKPRVNAVVVIEVHNDGKIHEVLPRCAVSSDLAQPQDIAANPNPPVKCLCAARAGGASIRPGVEVLERTALDVVTVVDTLGPAGAIAVDTRLNQVYVATGGGVQVIDCEKNASAATILTGRSAQSVAIDPITGNLYVGDGVEGTVTRLVPPALGRAARGG